MQCDVCGVEIRGEFRSTQFAKLSGEDQEFLERYLLAGFSIKALAEQSDMGYTAIRSRLDRLIEEYRRLRTNEDARLRILEGIERGEMTPEEAVRAMEKLEAD
ncbi:MAG: DUF2089 family protein [Candidatus Hydrogenedentes bacterium]|nr:DUF2089 family protein [Candidatus Hydrogenedentota bacterium]